MKKQINHMIAGDFYYYYYYYFVIFYKLFFPNCNFYSGHNLFEDTDVELNNVADEEKDLKLVTNDEEKQKSPTA